MRSDKHAHRTKPTKAPPPIVNTTDATRGQPIAMRARARKAELEHALAVLPADEKGTYVDIALALAEVNQWLVGDVAHLSRVTASQLNRWLERSKHLAEVAPRTRRPRG